MSREDVIARIDSLRADELSRLRYEESILKRILAAENPAPITADKPSTSAHSN